MYVCVCVHRAVGDLGRGEFVLVDRPEVFVAATATTALAYLGLHAVKVGAWLGWSEGSVSATYLVSA